MISFGSNLRGNVKLTMVEGEPLKSPCIWPQGGGWGPSSGGRWYLYPQQLIRKDVPKDGEEKEGDEGEDDDPPGALFLQTLLVAAQDQQAHADADHSPRQVCHKAGLRSGGGQRRRETEPDCTTHLWTHCRGKRGEDIFVTSVSAHYCSCEEIISTSKSTFWETYLWRRAS